MARLPVLKPREVVQVLEAIGFVEVRQRGSHKQFRHPDGRGTTVSFHRSRDISPFLLRQIRHIGPGHDSWVVGDEPYVSLHFLGAEYYAQR